MPKPHPREFRDEVVSHGWSISGTDNGQFYYEGTDADACDECGLVYDITWVNPKFGMPQAAADFTRTYDGAPIVTSRFVEAVSGCTGIEFRALPSAPGYFLVVVNPVVTIDTEARGVKERFPCSRCRRFREVSRAQPVYLWPHDRLPEGFSRTHIAYGSARDDPRRKTSQWPVLMVTEPCASRIRSARLDVVLQETRFLPLPEPVDPARVVGGGC